MWCNSYSQQLSRGLTYPNIGPNIIKKLTLSTWVYFMGGGREKKIIRSSQYNHIIAMNKNIYKLYEEVIFNFIWKQGKVTILIIWQFKCHPQLQKPWYCPPCPSLGSQSPFLRPCLHDIEIWKSPWLHADQKSNILKMGNALTLQSIAMRVCMHVF